MAIYHPAIVASERFAPTELVEHDLTGINFFSISLSFSPSVNVDNIREVRTGKNTDVLRSAENAGQFPDECAFSILYGPDFTSLDLIASSPDEANIWVTGLTCLLSGKGQKSESLASASLPDPLYV